MAFNVTFYTINKKVNSTRLPSDTGTTYSCVTKADFNMMNPTVILELSVGNAPETRNYAHIEAFNRYYFVDEWIYVDGLWNAKLSIDVLATYKTQIGSSTQYVVRSSSSYNLSIPDSTYPLTSDTTTLRDESPQSPWETNNFDNGMFVVGIIGTKTTYYIFAPVILEGFLNYLFSDDYLEDLVGGWATVFPQLKAQTNPLQYISSIQWLPYPTTTGIQVTSIKVGFVDVEVPIAWAIADTGIKYYTHTYTVRKHPQSATRGKYLNTSPYTNYMLFYPPWGTIHLDSDIMANSTEITCYWSLDLRSGRATLRVYGGTGFEHLLSWTHSQVSVNFQVSQVLNQGFSIASLIQPVASTVSGNYASAISGGIGAIGDAVKGKIPSATTVGSDGGLNALVGRPSMNYEFKTIVEEDLPDRGRPLCERRTLNTLSGYIVISDSHISISGATKNEQDQINTILEGGFYYE